MCNFFPSLTMSNVSFACKISQDHFYRSAFHSLRVLDFQHYKLPIQKTVILLSSILHQMCFTKKTRTSRYALHSLRVFRKKIHT